MNKALFHSDTINLDATLFVTWYQCLVSAAICSVLSLLSKLAPNYVSFPEGTPFSVVNFKKVIPAFHLIERTTSNSCTFLLQVIPLSIIFTAMIATNNLCLRYVSVSFYYVSRCLSTVFNVILTYLILGEKNSLQSILCCSLIVFGFVLGVDQESITGDYYGNLYKLRLKYWISRSLNLNLIHVSYEIF